MRVSARRTGLHLLWTVLFSLGTVFTASGATLSSTPALYCQDLLTDTRTQLVFSSQWPRETRQEFLFEKFAQAGIELDDYTLVKNQLSTDQAQHLIAPNFSEIRAGMRAALGRGQKVLLLNGSFDLVHGGHAAMVQAALHNFMTTENLSREQVYLVVLADADELIHSSKKHKWIAYGGTEPLPRPMQSLESIEGSSYELHPRAQDLGNLGADLVGLTPSPGEFLKSLNESWVQEFLRSANESLWLEKLSEVLAEENFKPEQITEVELVFNTAFRMIRALQLGEGDKIVADFESADPGDALPHWHVSSWQMVLQFAWGLNSFPEGSVHKVLNLRDAEYLHNVVSWSRVSGQTIHFIDGTDVFYSTTDLLKTFPMEELVDRKLRYYRSSW